jgi:galactokinase
MYMRPAYQRRTMTSTAKQRALGAFRARFGREPDLLARAPGRVNLIGEHVDYNGGLVLPVAIDRAAWLAIGRTGEDVVTIEAVDLGEGSRFSLHDLDTDRDRESGTTLSLPSWARYPAGVARVLAGRGLAVSGADVALASDVPIGAGLSSSAAVEVAFALSWKALGSWSMSSLELARLCQEAENRFVGVACGLMDPFTSIHGKRGHALLLDCRSLESKPVELPARTAIVIADTKVRRQLAESEFNLRRRQCEEAVEILRRGRATIKSLRDVSPAELDRRRGDLSEILFRRARHVVEEIARVEAVIPDVERGDAAALGRAMTAAHRSGRDLYDVSCYELDVLVESAVRIDGCYGARLTGAGFGGCTVSLVEAGGAARFAAELTRAYRAATAATPEIWICTADQGAEIMPLAAGAASPD